MPGLKDQPLTFTSQPNLEVRQRLQGLIAPMPEARAEQEAASQRAQAHTESDPRRAAAFQVRRGRFRRTVVFFTLLFIRVIAWEVIIRRFMGERFVARGRSARWRHYARRFRAMAVDMGGVMIKLGQFVSSRVDVLPPEITNELAGLQDQVPVVDFSYIRATIERELGKLDERFLWFNPEPIAAASFGQVHRAQLPNGDRVVVKVQRPNIVETVKTDLAALGVVARLAMRYKPIRRRANVPMLLKEFSDVLWEELDYLKEADHAMRFQSMFADDVGIYVPSVYLEYTTRYVLTLEDVTSIKLNDYAAIDRAGIDRREVAARLIDCYMRQIFDFRFFHADPHPGNLFVYPLPESHQEGAPFGKRKFYLIFIDFGMTGKLTEQLVRGLRSTLLAVITQDAKGLVESYKSLGVLMPDADTERLEQATRAVFDKVWGLDMNQLTNIPFEEMSGVALEFSDLIMSMPFQMPQDFIYLSRTVSILSGMCTGLDPRFDPWRAMQPYLQKLLADQRAEQAKSALNGNLFVQAALKSVRDFAQRTYRLPALADTVLTRAERGDLVVQVRPDSELGKQVLRIETTLGQLNSGLIFATLALASTLLHINGERTLSLIGFVLSGVLLLSILLRKRTL
ncbi:MAG: ABC transporter [Candidatus Thermofonsia Clade 1 bacterium]|uniref:ABC transporter n=1 Tax=Candidatus Thermofonsia Clade 1 bacterium TaxID=2364210 RepID=A0A2M8PB66_9CHLR|nr:MAG: ABC transporter [Candidatus Thermofonsia Clade 1 bacterium]PJF43261.1 MAG: ABC transporter [Candidatus Thermofonsia Clade 1 bacterium]RMF49329.1 MAG: AarF/ABC1/UbiB kinase family protein [Chloroflexota bacterium]